MNTTLTVQNISSMLVQYAGSDFIGRLNQVLTRLTNSGLWQGLLMESLHSVGADGYIVLPRGQQALVGVNLNNCPAPVYSSWLQVQELGPGWQNPDSMCLFGFIDVGQVCLQRQIEGDATLRVKLEDPADAGKVIRFFGRDEDEREIYSTSGFSGLNLTTVSPSVDTTQVFSAVTGIQAPFMQGYWSLWQVVAGVETQIGLYQPGEMVPLYRRYKCGQISDQITIRTYTRMEFVPVVAPTDWVRPSNVAAIKFGLQALTMEDAGRFEESSVLWEMSKKELDEDLAAYRGSNITTLRLVGPETMQNQPLGWGYGWKLHVN